MSKDMDNKKLKIANALSDLIIATEEALNNLDEWIKESKQSAGGSYASDKNYSLVICEYGDGSGKKADLSRCFGNTSLLLLIRDEVKKQLAKYKEDYAKL